MNTSPWLNGQLFALATLLILLLGLSRCTSVIDVRIAPGATQLSVDAFLNDKPGPQTIRLTRTAAYFDTSAAPAARGATVLVTDSDRNTYAFTDPDNNGYYVWTPTDNATLARIGRSYQLSIQYQNQTYFASSRMNRVPAVDSILFRVDKTGRNSTKEGYKSEFYATDFAGATDYYRVIYYRNTVLQNTPEAIRVVYDAAPDASANTDGLAFFSTIRQSANPADLYVLNDVVTVEIQSITAEAYTFFQELKRQLQSGGVFSTTQANLPTNILNQKSAGPPAVGLFSVSATHRRTAHVDNLSIRR